MLQPYLVLTKWELHTQWTPVISLLGYEGAIKNNTNDTNGSSSHIPGKQNIEEKEYMVNYVDAEWMLFPRLCTFPLIAVISKVSSKIKQDEVESIFVASYQPNQIWYPLMFKILISIPTLLKYQDATSATITGSRLELSNVAKDGPEVQKILRLIEETVDVLVINTEQHHSTKPEVRVCKGSNPAHGGSEACDGENLS